MISEKVRELLTPIQLRQNMETKELKQILDDLAVFIKSKVTLIEDTAKAYEDLKNSTIYQLKNNDKESEGLTREIARMQKMERIRLLAMT
jgi:CHASE3 domain sensor protein